jgi:mannose-1-phosphate guanylyltransferase
VLLGSAGTVHANAAWLDDADECVIVYADNLSSIDLRQLLQFHRDHEDSFTMVLFHTQVPSQCGIATLDATGRVVEFIEKPREPRSDLANAGIYVVDAATYRDIAAQNAFDLGFDVLPRLVGSMRGFVFHGYHRDIGTLQALEQAQVDAPTVFGGPA